MASSLLERRRNILNFLMYVLSLGGQWIFFFPSYTEGILFLSIGEQQ